MPAEPKIPYHSSFLMDRDGGVLRLAIAWRRVGNADYGLYLASDPSTSVIEFMATYTERGEIKSFLVSDKPLEPGMKWEEDHIDFEADPPEGTEKDASVLRSLANAFCDDWLESFGASQVEKLLRKAGGERTPDRAKGLFGILKSNLPIQVRPDRMPDILENARITENEFLYAFMAHSHGDAAPGSKALLEAKMKMFFELL